MNVNPFFWVFAKVTENVIFSSEDSIHEVSEMQLKALELELRFLFVKVCLDWKSCRNFSRDGSLNPAVSRAVRTRSSRRWLS